MKDETIIVSLAFLFISFFCIDHKGKQTSNESKMLVKRLKSTLFTNFNISVVTTYKSMRMNLRVVREYYQGFHKSICNMSMKEISVR